MIRIYVVVNKTMIDKVGAARSVICPYCFADIYFDEISPVYCHKCKEVLEPYSDIEKNIDARISYYNGKHLNTGNVLCFG